MRRLIDKLKKKIKLKIYNKARQLYLKKSICNIGKIIEEEDKIICYADQKSIDRYKGNKPLYKLRLNGMNQLTEGTKETVKNFRLNKPVYYIFDGIKFNTGLEITSLFSNVIFRNCKFDKNIGIIWGNEITFENNKYKDHCDIYFYGNCFFTADRVEKITFINDNFVNSYDLKKYSNACFGMQIDAKEIEFINTKVDEEYPATINIKAEKTRIENSELKANEVYIDSQSIDFVDSSVTALSGVMIENANCDFVGNVQAPIVFYNGIDLGNNLNENQKVSKEEARLKEAREKLVEKLINLSNYCQQLNNNRVQCIEDKFNGQTIAKTLKKGFLDKRK